MLEGKVVICRLNRTEQGQDTLDLQAVDIYNKEVSVSVPYIAVSHVRSAGLGNPSGTSLPLCQIMWLQSLVDWAVEGAGDKRLASFFWIDTLCLPLDKRLRGTALVHTGHIFATAQATMVHDPPMYTQTFTSGHGALIRIRGSTWKRRLWTLEEGSIAECLIFHPSNRMVNLKDLLETSQEGRDISLSIGPLLPPHYLLEWRSLPRLVDSFADDFKSLWKKRTSHSIPSELAQAKSKLKSMLRLGFLTNPRFRYFIEEDEYQHIPVLCNTLFRIYGSIIAEDKRTRSGAELEIQWSHVEAMIERSMGMSRLDT